jgi:hypothetical protein
MPTPRSGIDRRLQAALANPMVRVGIVHDIEEATLTEHGDTPYAAITLTWMEPAPDGRFAPQVLAMKLYVPQTAIPLLKEKAGKIRVPKGRHKRR